VQVNEDYRPTPLSLQTKCYLGQFYVMKCCSNAKLKKLFDNKGSQLAYNLGKSIKDLLTKTYADRPQCRYCICKLIWTYYYFLEQAPSILNKARQRT